MFIINKIYKKIRYRHRNEKKVCWGKENPSLTFYVIRLVEGGGLFSYVISGMGRISYAINHGYIPVVDMQNYSNTYLKKDEVHKKNAWEFYFKQPNGYTLSDICKSKNVILSDSGIIEDRPRATMECLQDTNGVLTFWREVASRNLIIQPEMLNAIEREYRRLFLSTDRVLGILCRGTDYTTLKPKGHWVQPEISDVIQKAEDVMETYNCNKIFLATEDIQIFYRFQQKFGDSIVLTNKKSWVNYQGGYINDCLTDRVDDNKIKGQEYLTTIAILARCNCFIGGRAGGTVGAMIMTKGYEYQYFWDLGVY